MLFARRGDPEVFRRYHDIVFERFWRRELDIESVPAIVAVLNEAGADVSEFAEWADGGRSEVAQIVRDAEVLGVFGVPSFILDGELYWGREHLADIREILAATSPT
jgi:2-hydroxychromene-2-carboxylate isomerase